jgi:hypothetical protein
MRRVIRLLVVAATVLGASVTWNVARADETPGTVAHRAWLESIWSSP